MLGSALAIVRNQLVLPATNMVINGDFAQEGEGWKFFINRTQSYFDGYVRNTVIGKVSAVALIRQDNLFSSADDGDKFYIRYKFRANFSTVLNMPYDSTGYLTKSYTDTGNWMVFSGTYQINNPKDITDMVLRQTSKVLEENDYYDIGNVININLTQTFGIGNEPTKAEMDALMAYFPNSWFDGTRNILPALAVLMLNKLRNLDGSSMDLRGTAATKPLATAVAVGATYWSVDTDPSAEAIEVSDGTNWVVI